MEPLHPKLREALKRAHPDLTDEDIDRFEELQALRFEFDPIKDADKIRELDLERAELIRRTMPRYKEVARAFAAQVAAPKPRRVPKVEIKRHDAADE